MLDLQGLEMPPGDAFQPSLSDQNGRGVNLLSILRLKKKKAPDHTDRKPLSESRFFRLLT
jgi:hypothetical protein